MASASCESASVHWHSVALRFAAAYNVFWGIVAILFPAAMFELLGIEMLPRYAEFLQCIGILVGTCGVGFWCASRDPDRHWPIVLVGLLSKIFGPIGLLPVITFGDFPWLTGLAIVTNNLIWGISFASILLHARSAYLSSKTVEQADYSMLNQRHKSRRRACSHVEVTVRASRETMTLSNNFTAQK